MTQEIIEDDLPTVLGDLFARTEPAKVKRTRQPILKVAKLSLEHRERILCLGSSGSLAAVVRVDQLTQLSDGSRRRKIRDTKNKLRLERGSWPAEELAPLL